ncbi:hypothetical protein NM208_g8260 [Fusarium decemcellulare]|uniref:Uncharacterized protein n=1 Tax=Fusarium decemcellulare TaxID=57161 RepID=A0ACC1S5Z2_9HYPO|nr:hypothetical protein NM208_g8260 [Fusarium decemcellulare]
MAPETPFPSTEEDDNEDKLFQDVMSQFPALNGHTQLILGFRLGSDELRDAIESALRDALDSLASQIPWLNGQVIRKDGILLPASWPADANKNEMIQRKDCDDLVPPMAELLRTAVPISKLDARVLSPFPGLSEGHKLRPPVPIVALQANFIRGGLLLTMCFHHIVMDGTAVVQFIRHLAHTLEGGEIPAPDLANANLDRQSVVPLIPPGEPVKDYRDLRRPPGFSYPALSSSPVWCYFKLPVAAVNALMKLVSSQLSSSVSRRQSAIRLSENDVISAFCWQRISAARLSTYPPATMSKFSRAIDGRLAAGVPLSYMGHMVYHASIRMPMRHIVSSTLADVAQSLRRALDTVNNEWTVRSYATFIAREPDKSLLLYGGQTNPNTDLGATSTLAGEDGWPTSFGSLLGKSLFLRRPRTTPITGSISLSPVEGNYVPLGLCLPEADLEALKRDTEWKKYTKLIG